MMTDQLAPVPAPRFSAAAGVSFEVLASASTQVFLRWLVNVRSLVGLTVRRLESGCGDVAVTGGLPRLAQAVGIVPAELDRSLLALSGVFLTADGRGSGAGLIYCPREIGSGRTRKLTFVVHPALCPPVVEASKKKNAPPKMTPAQIADALVSWAKLGTKNP